MAFMPPSKRRTKKSRSRPQAQPVGHGYLLIELVEFKLDLPAGLYNPVLSRCYPASTKRAPLNFQNKPCAVFDAGIQLDVSRLVHEIIRHRGKNARAPNHVPTSRAHCWRRRRSSASQMEALVALPYGTAIPAPTWNADGIAIVDDYDSWQNQNLPLQVLCERDTSAMNTPRLHSFSYQPSFGNCIQQDYLLTQN